METKGRLSLRPGRGHTTASQKPRVTSRLSPSLELHRAFSPPHMGDESCWLGATWGQCVDETKMGSRKGSKIPRFFFFLSFPGAESRGFWGSLSPWEIKPSENSLAFLGEQVPGPGR